MPYEVLGKMLVVDVDEIPEKYGSIYMPQGKMPGSFVKGTVVAIGDEVENVKVGARILKLNNLGTKVQTADDSKEFYIIPVDNVIAILTGEEALKQETKPKIIT